MEAYNLYSQAKQAVESPFNASMVTPLVTQVDALRNKTTHAGRKAELDALYQQLNDYSATVKIFQQVIRTVDGIISQQSQGGLDEFMKNAVGTGPSGI